VSPRISFVIPVRNDAVRLERCLTSIRTAAHAMGDVEVLVVDNGSTDRSPEVARAQGARVLVIENVRVSELRNRGAHATTGDILAFVDADNEIGEGWIDAAVETLQAGAGATGALYLAPPNGTWVQRSYGLLRGTTKGQHVAEWLGSGNLAIRRRVFESVGGFDTALEACEDVDLCNRVRAAGHQIVADARIGSIHHGDPRTLHDLFRSERWRGRDNLRVSFRRPIAWSAVPSAILPVVEALLFTATILGIVGWLAGWQSAATVVFTSTGLFVLAALLKAARAAARELQLRPASLLHTFVVAAVYDAARACALVTRAPHRSATPARAATTTS